MNLIHVNKLRFYFGDKDLYTQPDDINKLVKEISHPDFQFEIFKGWAHMSFSIGKKTDILMEKIISEIKKTDEKQLEKEKLDINNLQ